MQNTMSRRRGASNKNDASVSTDVEKATSTTLMQRKRRLRPVLPSNTKFVLAAPLLLLVLFVFSQHDSKNTTIYGPQEIAADNEFSRHVDDLLQIVANNNSTTPATAVCPCCGWHGKEFDPHKHKENRKCPNCRAFERHRRACAVLGTGGMRFPANKPWLTRDAARNEAGIPFRLVYFGPHRHMETVLNRMPNIDHVGLDYLVDEYAVTYSSHVLHADVTDIRLPTGFADGVLVFHVLEHIPHVNQSLQELTRILRRRGESSTSGWMLVEVPCRDIGQHKYCGYDNMTREERTACAGQWDHAWVYDCHEFANTLAQNGLDCYEIDGSHPADFGRAKPLLREACNCNDPTPQLYACTAPDTSRTK